MIKVFFALSLIITLISCNGKGKSHTGQFLPIAKSGSLKWEVEQEKIDIENTYFIDFPQGLQYTIEYKVPKYYNFKELSEKEHKQLAFPLAKHAYCNDLYKKININKFGVGKREVRFLGVVLFNEQGFIDQGYRTQFSIEEIKDRIQNEISFEIEITRFHEFIKNQNLAHRIMHYDNQYLISRLTSIHGKNLIDFRIAKSFRQDKAFLKFIFNKRHVLKELNYDEIESEIRLLVTDLTDNTIKYENVYLELEPFANKWISDMISNPKTAYENVSEQMREQITLEALKKGSKEIKQNLGTLKKTNYVRGEFYTDFPGTKGELISLIYNLEFNINRNAGVRINFSKTDDNDWRISGFNIVPL